MVLFFVIGQLADLFFYFGDILLTFFLAWLLAVKEHIGGQNTDVGIFVVTGHGGTGQSKALSLADKKLKNLVILNPYHIIKGENTKIEHADEYETSLLWACYPEQEKISRSRKIPASDDCFRFYGYDLRRKASLTLGKKISKEMVENCLKDMK